MPITRAKATQLLNKGEMALYDDSRANALRQLDARSLAARVRRARTARDRARDLVQKHKLASRARTGSKRGASGVANQRSKDKAGLLADILRRFELRLKEVERAGAPARKSAARTTTGKASGSKAVKKTSASVARKAATNKTTAAKGQRMATGKASAASGAAAKKGKAKTAASRKGASASGRKATTRKARKRSITPEQALAQTRALLEAKQAQDAAPKPWQALDGGGAPDAGQPGYQSDQAARRAQDLHAAESRIPAIQGSASTRDRIQQGKRDHRGDGD